MLTRHYRAYLGNGPHCDSWFYFGLSNVKQLGEASSRYHASRIGIYGPNLVLGELLGSGFGPRQSAVLALALLGLVACLAIQKLTTSSFAGISVGLLVITAPAVRSFSSSSYAGATLAIVFLLGAVTYFWFHELVEGEHEIFPSLLLGVVAGSAYLTNAHVLWGAAILVGALAISAMSIQLVQLLAVVRSALYSLVAFMSTIIVVSQTWELINFQIFNLEKPTRQARFFLSNSTSGSEYSTSLAAGIVNSYGYHAAAATLVLGIFAVHAGRMTEQNNSRILRAQGSGLALAGILLLGGSLARGMPLLDYDFQAMASLVVLAYAGLVTLSATGVTGGDKVSALSFSSGLVATGLGLGLFLTLGFFGREHFVALNRLLFASLLAALVFIVVIVTAQRIGAANVGALRWLPPIVLILALGPTTTGYSSLALSDGQLAETRQSYLLAQHVYEELGHDLRPEGLLILGASTREDTFLSRSLWGGAAESCGVPDFDREEAIARGVAWLTVAESSRQLLVLDAAVRIGIGEEGVPLVEKYSGQEVWLLMRD